MQVFDDLQSLKSAHPNCVATIGKYDGMHLGHQKVLARVKGVAESLGLPSLVILSEPQPEEFFAGENAPARLCSFLDKVDFLERQDVDLVYKMTFDKSLSAMEAEDFVVKVLVEGLGVKALLVGDDFHFGKNRKGNFSLLKKMGSEFGFTVEATETFSRNAQRVSSTLLRQTLEEGDCQAATELLGRPYQLHGKVISGQKLGRELGYPTANIQVGMSKLALDGVFAVKVEFEGREIEGAASVGYKPTIEGQNDLAVEVFLFDFNEDIYGKNLTVKFLYKLRGQEKFADLEQLKRQIDNDVQKVKSYFEEQFKNKLNRTLDGVRYEST